MCRPPALAEEAAAPRTASAGLPGGLAGYERELQGQAGLDVASAGLGSRSRLFSLLPPCLFVLDVPANRALRRWALTLAATQACSAGAGRDGMDSQPLLGLWSIF